MANTVDFTILIPAYREEKRIGKTLDELAKFVKSNSVLSKLAVEVLVVAADAGDKTHQVVLGKKEKFTNLKLLKPGLKVGKGRDVQYGMLRAKGDAVIFMDADLATPLKYLPVFYTKFKEGGDVVIATRNLHKHHESFLRRSLSNTGNILFRIASGVWVEDSQCGFKLFSKNAAKTCFSNLQIKGWGFDMEVLAIARANKLKIVTHRIDDWVSVPEGTFENGFLCNAMASLGELSAILYRRVTKKYY